MTMEQAIANLFVGVVIAVISSWLTIRFSLNRFYSEKWFEQRLKAYKEIIESLHYMKHFTEQRQCITKTGSTSQKETEDVIRAYEVGLDKLLKCAHMGELLLSFEALVKINQLIDNLEAATQKNSWWECLDNEAEAISKCLTDIVPLAQKHLKA